ncbi:MAG: helix-turn-helix domain-containing protein [Actinobacteria bacterium]|nr:MAG: helix-turn-helix domain-containing protein [Actinomycetota bacterium]
MAHQVEHALGPPVLTERQRQVARGVARGLSQREIGGPGVSYAYVSRIEKGERTPSLRAIRTMAAGMGVTPEYLETGRDHTTTDQLAAEALRLTDGALWIVLPREGVTLTWQRAGDRYQLDQPGGNLTETLYATLDHVEELLRLDVEEERIQTRREEIGREWAAPESGRPGARPGAPTIFPTIGAISRCPDRRKRLVE